MEIGGFIMVGTAFSKKNYKICSCMPISKENKGGNYSKVEIIQGRKLVYKKGSEKKETIQRRKVYKGRHCMRKYSSFSLLFFCPFALI